MYCMLTDIFYNTSLSKRHIPPRPASNKTHTKEETQRNKRENVLHSRQYYILVLSLLNGLLF